MVFNSNKFEWVRYDVAGVAPPYQYTGPDKCSILQKESLKDLGVRLSPDLSFTLQIEKVVTSASQMVGWGLRTFRSRSSYLLLTVFKSLVQPHLDYCSQLWSPNKQSEITVYNSLVKFLPQSLFFFASGPRQICHEA